MKPATETAPDEISCFHDVQEQHDGVEPEYAGQGLRPGYVLDGRFVIGKALSRSGMATIYQATDSKNGNQPVAIKVPLLRYEADPTFYTRFQREEEIGRMFDHPSILKFIPVEGKSRPYLVMEYLSGCTLAHLMDAMRPLLERDALKICSRICEALTAMHALGVVHRDLKPGNIMICRDRSIRIMDFGIAISTANSRRLTMAGFSPMLGTPDYMAPEQVRGNRVDERTDIYSLGVILYEMLTGVIPFQHENPWAALTARVNGDPPAPRKLNPEISPQAEEIVLRAMQRDPANRYPTAAAFKQDLDAPDKVVVTGLCRHLKAPGWHFGLRETPVIAGIAIGLGFITFQVVLFLFIMHAVHHR